MDWFMETSGKGLLIFAISVGILWHFLKKNAPDVADAGKKAAASKALGLITRWLK